MTKRPIDMKRPTSTTSECYQSEYLVRCADVHCRAQQALGPTVQRILQNIEEQTGLIGLFTFVGPQPARGGNIGAVT